MIDNTLFSKTAAEFVNKFNAPVKEFNTLLVDHIEQLSRLQLKAAENYTNLGLEQLKASTAITDAKSAQEFVKNQAKTAETVSRKLNADGEALLRLNQQFAVAVQKLAQDAAKAAIAKAA